MLDEYSTILDRAEAELIAVSYTHLDVYKRQDEDVSSIFDFYDVA